MTIRTTDTSKKVWLPEDKRVKESEKQKRANVNIRLISTAFINVFRYGCTTESKKITGSISIPNVIKKKRGVSVQ